MVVWLESIGVDCDVDGVVAFHLHNVVPGQRGDTLAINLHHVRCKRSLPDARRDIAGNIILRLVAKSRHDVNRCRG